MKISEKYLKEVIKHCKNEYPKEACGILAGKISNQLSVNSEQLKDKIVTKVYKMKNVSESPQSCYLIEPEEQLRVFKEMRSLDYELIGIYHSHIGISAYPSQRDIEMAYYPEAIYVIVSLEQINNLTVRGFKIIESKIEEVSIEMEGA